MKQAAQEALDSVSGFGESISGRIKMSVPCISGDLVLADAVAEFCTWYPELNIDMSLDNRFVDLVDGGYDLVIRTGYLEDSSLIARHILDSQWLVCASPSYLSRNGRPSSLKILQGTIVYNMPIRRLALRTGNLKAFSGNYIVKVSGNFSTDNAIALRKAAIGGHGIAYVPRCLVYHDLGNGQLIDIFPDLVGKRLGIYAVYPFTRQPTKKVKMLIEHIRTRYLEIKHYFK